MQTLNLPEFEFKLRKNNNKTEIFDELRKKYVALQPEEWVRQNFVQYLIHFKNFPAGLIGIEISLKFNQMNKRADIVIHDRSGKPVLLVECKAPEVKITQSVFNQIARYNMAFKLNYLIVTNGIEHYCCKIDHTNQSFNFLSDIPASTELGLSQNTDI